MTNFFHVSRFVDIIFNVTVNDPDSKGVLILKS